MLRLCEQAQEATIYILSVTVLVRAFGVATNGDEYFMELKSVSQVVTILYQ
jgi:hypothetical protein